MKTKIILALVMVVIGHSMCGQSAVEGRIADEKNNTGIPFANVILAGTTTGTSSDLDGNYRLENLKPGLYNIIFSSVGFASKTIFEVEVSGNRTTFLDVALSESTVEIGEVSVVGSSFSNRDEAPVSARSIGVNEVKRNPGGNRDISKALRSLPGVATTSSFRNDIVIRGGAPNENRFYIDGIEVPNINHFATQGSSGGPVGLINVDFINSVEFYSGAFPASRGNALSSVLDFGFKEGRKDRFSANAVLGSSDVGLTFEGPTGENSSLIVSARRSYLQYLFQFIGLPFLPTYNDFQFKWKTTIDDKNQITLLGLGAIDQFALNTGLADPGEPDFERNRYILDLLSIQEQWNYTVGARWDHFHESGLTSVFLSRNMLNNRDFKHEDNVESNPLIWDYESFEAESKFRVEHKSYLPNGWKATYGGGVEKARYFNSSDIQRFGFSADSIQNVVFENKLDLNKLGVFGQISKSLAEDRLTLSLGVRTDINDYSDEMSNPIEQLSPRFSARYMLTPLLSLSFNTGIYYQLPSYTVLGYTEDDALVNRENGVGYIQNQQLVAGLTYSLDKRNTILSLEGFLKDYNNYPFSIDKQISLANLGADFGVIGNEAVTSSSEGRAYGLEFLVQQKLFEGIYGILAYTYVRSEFTDALGKYIPSAWDSRHLISATGGKKFKKDWEVGLRFLYSGGLPFTPYDVANSVSIPVWNVAHSGLPDYSRLNEGRLDAFHQLDLRVDKKWYFDRWSLNVFLDIQNLYGAVTPQQEILDVVRNEIGNPIEDPSTPGSYQPRFLDTSSGTVLPSIGIILEL